MARRTVISPLITNKTWWEIKLSSIWTFIKHKLNYQQQIKTKLVVEFVTVKIVGFQMTIARDLWSRLILNCLIRNNVSSFFRMTRIRRFNEHLILREGSQSQIHRSKCDVYSAADRLPAMKFDGLESQSVRQILVIQPSPNNKSPTTNRIAVGTFLKFS